MAITKTKTENNRWRERGKTATFVHCWWERKTVQLLWKTVWWSLKKLNKIINNSTSGYLRKRTESMDLERFVYTQVCSSVSHGSRKETTHVSTDGRADKQSGVDTYKKILFGLKKEGRSDTCDNTDKPEDIMLSDISVCHKRIDTRTV